MEKSPFEQAERSVFQMAVSDAERLAKRGDRPAAYACLLAGLRRMEEFVTGGEGWAKDLQRAYEGVAQSYDASCRSSSPVSAAHRRTL